MRLLPLLLLCGCTFQPLPPDPEPLEGDCASACANLRNLGCPEAENGPDGQVCEADCEIALKEGVIDPRTGCLSHVKACGEVAACFE